MNGLTKSEVRKAVEDGWGQDCLLLIHKNFSGSLTDYKYQFLNDYQMLVENVVHKRQFYIYRSYNVNQVEWAFFGTKSEEPAVCYCDGSGTKESICGIGVVIYQPGQEPVFIAENIGIATNNIAELRAVGRALKNFPNLSQKLIIRTDSQYTIGMLSKNHVAVANQDLVQRLALDVAGRRDNIVFEHVDGHSGVEGNEVADKLANIGRKLVTAVSLF